MTSYRTLAPSPTTVTGPPLRLVFGSLLRADFLVFLKHRRALITSMLLPLFVLVSTSGNKSTQKFGGAEFVIGLAIAYGLLSTSLIGYALTVARDREKGVFQRLRVTPAPTWTIMTSRLALQALANLLLAIVTVIIGSMIHHISPSAGQYALVLLVSILAGAVFLSLGQALVGLVKSADSVQAGARVLFAVLILLGLLGQSGALGPFWSSVARWSPVGAVMTLFAGVLDLHSWYSRDTLSVLACLGYVVVFAGIGIRWFQWDAR
ncbi:MAG TPA: ABC transporter permease [Solirubrobacteraceae bacterium]|nr:ABC transporter permease [Solirubrobacteraceae bacterium]